MPVVVVSAFSPAHGARAVDALAEGAVDLVAKPHAGAPFQAFLDELAEKMRLAAGSRQANGHAAPAQPRAAAAGSSRAARPSGRPARGRS